MGKERFDWRNDECPDDEERLARGEMDDSHLKPLPTHSEMGVVESDEENSPNDLSNEGVEVDQELKEEDLKALHHPLDPEEDSEDEQEKENEDSEEN